MDPLTFQFILNKYLYGSDQMPSSPDQRLRPAALDGVAVEQYVDTASYMNTVGRFAHLADADIVSSFFSGGLDQQKHLGTTDSNGVTRLPLTALYTGGEPPESARFVVYQYTAGITESDFAYRAFIWGSTSFVLSGQTTFVWGADGSLSIENGSVRPHDTDFDFQTGSTPIQQAVQIINDTILAPVIDPYDIGEKVLLKFGADTKAQWDASHVGDVYTQADFQNFVKPDYVFANVAAAIAGTVGALSAYSVAVAALAQQLINSEAIQYTYNGKDIIYGSSEGDSLNYDSHVGLLTGVPPYTHGAFFVGGDGSDSITGGIQDDILSGGSGNDTADYSSNLSSQTISINFDGTSSAPILTVQDGLGGTDTLHSIENIKGTVGADKIIYKGSIPSGYNLTIDANGGQAGVADIIDAKDSSDLAGMTVKIDQTSGRGYISSRSGAGGKINLLNFNTDIIGSEYSDLISDESEHDHLVDGKGGDDNITVGGLDATVDGGAGNDVIHLKSQSATIKFGAGGGSDVVEFDAGDGDYTLALQNLNQDDIEIIAGGHSIYGTGNDGLFLQFITVRISQTGDQITFLENGKNIGPSGSTYDTSGNSRKLGSITFADGTVLTQAALSDQLAQAALGINSLPIMLDTWGYKKDFPFSANYLSARHYADEYRDYVNATYLQAAPIGTPPPPPDQNLSGTPDDENFNPGKGNDFVDGGGGNDSVQESQGNDTYVWNLGDGDDTIVGSDASDGFDTLQLGAGISPADLRFAIANDGAGLTLSFANQTGSISLGDGLVGEGYGVDRILFADGTAMMRTDWLAAASSVIAAAQVTVNGTASADFLRPPRGNFIVNGAGGDDTITVSGSGAGTFRFSSADGHDEINDWGFGYNRNDTLELTNVNADGVSLSRSGDALLVTVNSTGASVNVTKQFEQDDGNTHGISTIKFADGTIWTRTQIRDLVSAAMGNTSPVAQAATATAIEDAALVRGTLVATDADAGDVLKFKLDDVVDGLVLAANGQWSFDPTAASYNYLEAGQSLVINADYHVTDTAGATSSSTLTITIAGTEDMADEPAVPPIYGTTGNDTLIGGIGDDSLYGGDGDDSIDGAAGADLMAGGSGSDFYYADNAGDIIVEVADEGWDGVSSTISFVLPDNVEGLYLGGDAALDGTGNDLDNEIYGNDYANALSGMGGADYIVGGWGDDRLIGGAGNDLLAGEDGSADVAVYAGLQSSFSIATIDGTVTITDNDPTVDGDEGSDSLYGIEVVEFQGGVQAGISSPIVLDLNGNGVSLVDNRRTKVAFDWDGDGIKNQTGWIGKDDGFLFIDRDGNGTVTNGGELSFTSDKDGAKSDLDGLRAFDSNGDGIFSSADDHFAQFKVWRDRNGNGRVDKKEIMSLQKAGVASIDLAGTAVNRNWEWGENLTVNTGSFTRTNGTTGSFSDVALSYDTGNPQNASINKAASQLSEAIAGFFGDRGTSDFASHESWMENRADFVAGSKWFGR
ncbi:beta strand repeat-containing protein [Sphingobium sp. Cam5-1]|uniref:beta strand repeat-containing protein n=1 Tax=Sphingobium sp. Cam5-1 TaxID=2789327 RepID=UPI0018AD1AFA|nr:calcium-binding protein [Sphingobium sp. Cam5-1]QPI73403.1 hypothetical protein IZV00_02580 [Sphingobium sp. Cam5-1]QPI75540.1 hypothetical protein IZV00_19000 [Sphingobium sp. Cam5-1]QPI75711.1 hypothetical protein IZV00_20320 [Sphingobium sp. Cam5-1]